MLTRVALLMLAGAVTPATAACGGSADGDKTFQGNGYSFSYPATWAAQGGDANTGRIDALVAPPEGGQNVVGLTVVRDAVATSATKTNLDQVLRESRPAVDALMLREAGALEGALTKVTYGGLPGFRFEASSTGLEPAIHQRGTWLFDGTTAYTFSCQSIPSGAEAVAKACDLALGSFETSK